MQFIVESSWSFAVFVFIALLMMMVATYFIFVTRRRAGSVGTATATGGMWRWLVPSGKTLPTIIAFGMMFIGMALVGAWYYIQVPIIDDYTFNILAVTFIAALLAAVAAYGIALIGLYATSLRGRKL